MPSNVRQMIATPGGAMFRSRYRTVGDWCYANRSKVIAWYPLNDRNSGTMTNNMDFTTLIGSYSADAGLITGQIQGTPALDVAGTSSLPGGGTLNDDALWDTIQGIFCVVRFDTTNDGAGEDSLIVRRMNPESNGVWVFDRTTANKLRFFNYSGGTYPIRTGTTTLGAGTYTLGAGTVGGNVQLYVNGVDEIATGGSSSFEVGSAPIYVGTHGTNGAGVTNNANLEGKICDIVILSACTAQTFTELHQAWFFGHHAS